MLIRAVVICCFAVAGTFSVCSGDDASEQKVTVEFLSKRSESAFTPGPRKWPINYVLHSGGAIWLMQRPRYMTDERLGRVLAYSGTERRTQHLFLYVNDPERTKFSDVMLAIDRLKKIVAKHVTGNCTVVIEVLPRDWVFVYPPDEPDEADQVHVAGVNESEPNDAPERAADVDPYADAP